MYVLLWSGKASVSFSTLHGTFISVGENGSMGLAKWRQHIYKEGGHTQTGGKKGWVFY